MVPFRPDGEPPPAPAIVQPQQHVSGPVATLGGDNSAAHAGVGMQTDQRPQSDGVVAIAWVIAVVTFLYMLPWAVAVTRGRANLAAIGLVNLFLGWSFVGWVVALVMACQSHQVLGVGAPTLHATTVTINPPGHIAMPIAGWYAAPDGHGRQYWDGQQWTSHRAP